MLFKHLFKSSFFFLLNMLSSHYPLPVVQWGSSQLFDLAQRPLGGKNQSSSQLDFLLQKILHRQKLQPSLDTAS